MMTLNGTELKPSIVLQAMVTGLRKSKDDPRFTIEMSSFGHVKDRLCYGCAATATLTEMFGKGQSASEIMLSYAKISIERSEVIDAYLSDALPLDPSSTQDSLSTGQLYDLEKAIDFARVGVITNLIKLLTGEVKRSFNGRWILKSNNWEEQLPIVESTIAEMAAAGY